jgi:hypothetical protein
MSRKYTCASSRKYTCKFLLLPPCLRRLHPRVMRSNKSKRESFKFLKIVKRQLSHCL